jgi:hypothetical protein
MDNLANWNEISKGFYRYVIATCVCYEIHILYHAQNTDILTAKASLYLVGEWINKDCEDYFERECLQQGTVADCLETAFWDNAENNKK